MTEEELQHLVEQLAARLAERLRLDQSRLITLPELAERLSLSPSGVTGLVARGELPAGLLIGGARRWDWDVVRRWLDNRATRRPRRRRRGQYDRDGAN